MKERKLRVYEGNGWRYKSIPKIILQGDWLKEYGFWISTKIIVECYNNRLVIKKDDM